MTAQEKQMVAIVKVKSRSRSKAMRGPKNRTVKPMMGIRRRGKKQNEETFSTRQKIKAGQKKVKAILPQRIKAGKKNTTGGYSFTKKSKSKAL